MLTTKTRNALITGIVTVGLAVPAVAPAISQAQAVNPGTHAALCETYRLTAELWSEAAQTAFENGEMDLSHYYSEKENEARDAAKAEGCAWAATIVHQKVQAPVATKAVSATKSALATH